MSPEIASRVAAIGCATPFSMERPKRFAKELQKLFPMTALSACQEVTAHVFGHQDWYHLRRAVEAAPDLRHLDTDLSEEELITRLVAQSEILVIEMAGLDPDQMYDAPPSRGLDPAADTSPREHAFLRMDRARNRLSKHLAAMFILEQTPTDVVQIPLEPVQSLKWSVATPEFMATYNKKLAQWWRTNIPHQPEVGQAIDDFSWDPSRTTSILRFADYWGSLGVFYSDAIDFSMGMGTAYLLAEQYAASLLAQKDEEYRTKDVFMDAMYNFMQMYPRDDFIAVFPDALKKNAKVVLKILSDPNSRKGTWEAHGSQRH